MVGAGILPVSIYRNQIYFLFAKENSLEKSAPGYSDFGGTMEMKKDKKNELLTAVRESNEESTGFLGNPKLLLKYFKSLHPQPYKIKIPNANYTTFLLPIEYDEKIIDLYNYQHSFFEKQLPKQVFRKYRIFEKSRIQWVPLQYLEMFGHYMRSFYKRIIPILINNKKEIQYFIESNVVYLPYFYRQLEK